MTAESVPDRSPKGLDKGAKAGTILNLVLQGKSDREIAETLGVDRKAIWHWRRRNADVVVPAVQAQEQAIESYAISRKANRIAKLDNMAQRLDEDLSETGYTYTEETRHGKKIHAHPAASELRATLQQAALELDQLPRAGVTVNNQNVVIVRQVSGPPTEAGNPEL